MINFFDRLDKFMKFKGLNDNRISVETGISNGLIGKGRKRGAISQENISKILYTYPEIDANWLLTGKGSMLKKNIPVKNNKESEITVSDSVRKGIPYVTQQAVAGFGNNDFSISEQDVKDYYIIPVFKYLHIDFMIDVRGSSMVPKYNSGDIIACTIIRERTFIQWNKCHVIATREQGILVKRLRQSDRDGHLTAISDNKEYPPFDIPLSEITGIALVVGVIRLE